MSASVEALLCPPGFAACKGNRELKFADTLLEFPDMFSRELSETICGLGLKTRCGRMASKRLEIIASTISQTDR